MLEEDFDAFLFAGDLTDPDTPGAHAAVALLCEVASACAKRGKTFLAIPGNHDVCEDGKGTTTLAALAGLETGGGTPLIRVFEKPAAKIIKVGTQAFAFVALPYPSRCNDYDPTAFVDKLAPTPVNMPVLVAGHLWVRGDGGQGSESTELGRGRPVYWPTERKLKALFPDALVIGGHYHTPGPLEGVLMIGAPERLTFADEKNMPRFLMLETGGAR